jgi:hypothetical protein
MGISIKALSFAILFGLLPALRVRTVQALPEASIARRGLLTVKTPIERTVMVGAGNLIFSLHQHLGVIVLGVS